MLTGNGKVDFGKADLKSGKILFIKRKFFSDTADFHLKAFDEEGFTFSTVNVNARIDFDKREGEFISNGEGSYVRFDKNQYIAYMDRFKWFMDSEDIELGDQNKKMDENVENALDLEGPQFISVHPKQDSLSFFAPAAKYNLRKYIIRCLNVPFINVADARIFPDSGKVIIYKNAVIDTLKRASILANTVTKHHRIRNVTANIFSKRNYLGSGEYMYLDENEKKYMIKFSVIKPDTSGTTTSEGTISEKDQFMFNDYFTFAGKVTLRAINPHLFFDGGTKIVHPCSRVRKSYLKFAGDINPKDILIPIPEDSKDMFGNQVVNAVMYALDTTAIYSGFLSPKSSRADKKIISASGFLTFDKESGEYQISNKEKLIEQNLPGNYLSLSTKDCVVYGEGKMDLGTDFGQVQVNPVGSVYHYTASDSAAINLLMTVNFFFDDKDVNKRQEQYEANNKQPYTVVDLAKFLKVMAVDLRQTIFKYAIYGLIYFDPETDLITPRQRLYDYQMHAKHTLDYDILTIHSVNSGQDNAMLNLLNYDLTVYGVKNVLLSDTQKVFIFPKDKEIVLRKNRNIEFSGVVASGKFEFHGKDFIFDYEQFKIKMKTIDSMKIYVESFEPDVNGNINFKRVGTVIENANGELRIDAPKNKSGWGRAPTFPQFQSFKESYAYYDSRTIFKGVYNRDKFYFRLDPFTMDSLDNFRSEGLQFDGDFVSAGIFPTFREKLSLQKDYSLGFVRPTPPGGYKIYGGVGNFEQEIRLSNKGLRGGGDFTYSASKSKVPDLIFFPDSANGVASTYDVTEQEVPDEFPVVHGDTVYLHFMPYKELLQSLSLIHI